MLLAVDPSLRSSGVAVFDDGRLIECARVTVKPTKEPIPRRAAVMAERILSRWVVGTSITRLVVEWPQIYRAGKSKGDPNDLLGLAAIAGVIVSGCVGSGAVVLAPTPGEWAGRIPKYTTGDAWASPRGSRIWSRLDAAERATATTANNDTIDAIGLGLWALGRMVPTRVVSRGSKLPGVP